MSLVTSVSFYLCVYFQCPSSMSLSPNPFLSLPPASLLPISIFVFLNYVSPTLFLSLSLSLILPFFLSLSLRFLIFPVFSISVFSPTHFYVILSVSLSDFLSFLTLIYLCLFLSLLDSLPLFLFILGIMSTFLSLSIFTPSLSPSIFLSSHLKLSVSLSFSLHLSISSFFF